MNDFEQGRDQALANVDAILLDEMNRYASTWAQEPGVRIKNVVRYKLLVTLRRRIKTLAPPATELRLAGNLGIMELDPEIEESL